MSEINENILLVGNVNVGMVKFLTVPYPRTFQSFIETLVSPFVPPVGYGGLYAFSKKAWLETEDRESVKNRPRAEDRHLRLSIQKRYEIAYVRTRTLHLRPRETPKYHYKKGITRRQEKRGSLLACMIHSFMYLRPLVLSGYLKARFQSGSSD